MKKKIFLSIISVIIVLMLPLIVLSRQGSDELEYDQFYRERKHLPLGALKAEGMRHIQNECSDSALACFALMESHIKDPMPAEDYEMVLDVLNNTGYVYQYMVHDYPQAFNYYTRALTECERVGYHKLMPCLYLNLANVYEYFDEHVTAHHLYNKAVALSIEYDRPEILAITLNNLLMGQLLHGLDARGDSAIMAYRNTNMPDSVPLSQYLRHLVDGYQALRNGNYATALGLFQLAQTNIDTEYRPVVYYSGGALAIAVTHLEAGNPQSSIQCLEDAFAALGGEEDDDIRLDLYRSLAKCYHSLGLSAKEKDAYYNYLDLTNKLHNAHIAIQLHDIKTRQEISAHNEQMREMARKHRMSIIISSVVTLSLLIIVGLLWMLYSKGQRQRQLIEDLYHRALAQAQAQVSEPYCPPSPPASAASAASAADSPAQAPEPAKSELASLYKNIQQVMVTNAEVYDSGFTVNRLAEILGAQPRRVSLAIKEVGEKNFATLLAECRVQEACRRIADQEKYGRYTLSAISESVGFLSRTNFTAVFKRVTGLSPREFQAMSRK